MKRIATMTDDGSVEVLASAGLDGRTYTFATMHGRTRYAEIGRRGALVRVHETLGRHGWTGRRWWRATEWDRTTAGWRRDFGLVVPGRDGVRAGVARG